MRTDIRELVTKVEYLAWCAANVFVADRSCPACAATARLVRRKYLVSALFECEACRLRFRVPKDDPALASDFYNGAYRQGFSGSIPSAVQLEHILHEGTTNTWGGSYSRYLPVLHAAGLAPGSTILDFGAAWGYGCHQLRRAGYNVLGYEIDRTRAKFAAEKLGVRMIEDPRCPPEPIDCFFSAHVIEHIADTKLIWQTAGDALCSGGLLILFMPNGDPVVEGVFGSERYHTSWGQWHPLFVTSDYLRWITRQVGFGARIYSSPLGYKATEQSVPYDTAPIAAGTDGDLRGLELCLVARKL
jgi:2-polyprenyl-3-methyl-5-hydroxy-6-metoxy-1,4-benzoquinol methylase